MNTGNSRPLYQRPFYSLIMPSVAQNQPQQHSHATPFPQQPNQQLPLAIRIVKVNAHAKATAAIGGAPRTTKGNIGPAY
jgi:hypothetical protein